MWKHRGGWKKYQKLIVGGGGGIVGGGGGRKKLKILIAGRGRVGGVAFKLLEHFKMINRRLSIHKFCKNSKKRCSHPPGQYLLERLCFRLHQGPTFLRLSTCVFRFY